jgi:hypothetical protein
MRIALATLASFAILCGTIWAADKAKALTGSNPKPNKISEKMAGSVVQSPVGRNMKMKDDASLRTKTSADQLQVLAPKDSKKTHVDKGPVKMNKISDKRSKLMLKAPSGNNKMKLSAGSKSSDKIQSLEVQDK